MSERTYGLVAVMQAMKDGRIPSEVSASDRAVLLVYADYAGEDGIAWPALDRVKAAAGCSTDSVRRSLAVLLGVGVLRLVSPDKMTREARAKYERISPDRRPRVYELDLTGLQVATSQDATPQDATSQDAATGVASCGERGSKMRPKSLKETPKETPTIFPNADASGAAGGGGAPGRTRKAKQAKPEATPGARELKAYWYELHERHRGAEPCQWQAKDNVAVKSTLTAIGLDEAKRRLDNAWADPWFRLKGTVSHFGSSLDTFITKPSPHGQPKKATMRQAPIDCEVNRLV